MSRGVSWSISGSVGDIFTTIEAKSLTCQGVLLGNVGKWAVITVLSIVGAGRLVRVKVRVQRSSETIDSL